MTSKKFNTFSSKVILALLLVSFIPLTIHLGLNNIILKNYFFVLEKKSIESKSILATKILNNELNTILVTATDYSIWDDLYERTFPENRNDEWIKENFSDWIPHNFDVDLMVLLTKDLEVMDSFGLDKTGYSELMANPKIIELIAGNYNEESSFPHGVILYKGSPYILTATPILKSDYSGPSRGALIIAKEISPLFLQSIKDKFGYNLLLGVNNFLIANSEETALVNKFSDAILNNNQKIIELNNSIILAQNPISDITGINNFKLYIVDSRDVFFSTLELLEKNGHSVLLMSALLMILLSYALKNMITRPITSLQSQLTDMNSVRSLKYIKVQGSDEIKNLADSFNALVKNIHSKEKENIILKKQNHTDDLTSLYNHRDFHHTLKSIISSKSSPISIIFMDLDKFRIINDISGHTVGDKVLSSIGKLLTDSLPEGLKAFRYGGEEFAILANDYSVNKAYHLAENIRISIIKSNEIQSICKEFPITVSFGLASYPAHTKDPFTLLDKADRAMYFAKQNGRNQTCTYNKDLESLLELNNKNFKKKELTLDTALAFSVAIDAKDHYTGNHSEMVTKFSLLLAEKMQLPDEDKYCLRIGALLHDCGKIGIPDNIIGKSDKLTLEELSIIKEHPLLGNSILKYIIDNDSVMSCVRNHHERWDGYGYPDALSGEEIPLYARIVTLADSFHAMVSDRPYRKCLSLDSAIDELRKNSGTQFDPSLVELFIEAVQEYYYL